MLSLKPDFHDFWILRPCLADLKFQPPQIFPKRSTQKIIISTFLQRFGLQNQHVVFIRDIWVDKILRGIITLTSEIMSISWILYARAPPPTLQFFPIFTCLDAIFSDSQIDEMVSECPEMMKIPKSSLYTLIGPGVSLTPI